MSAYGIMQTTAPAGRSGGITAGAANSSQTQAGESAGFAGMLVQVIGETPGSDNSTTGNGLLVGLPGGAGLLGTALLSGETAADEPEAKLLPLLQGLLKQLATLEPNGELPADFEQKLASLLGLLQDLLKVSEDALLSGAFAADAYASALPGNTAAEQQLSTANGRSIVQTVTETLQQWIGNLSQGNKLTVGQLAALAETLRQVQQLVQKPSTPGQANPDTGLRVAPTPSSNIPEGQARTANSTAAAASSAAQTGAQVETIVQRTTTPFRQPIWMQQATAVPAAEGQLTGAPTIAAAADAAEPASPTAAVPIWTLSKGDAGAQPPSGTQVQTPLSTPVPVQQFAEQMGKFLVKQFVLSRGDGTTEARISLHPEHLGQVNIKIMIQNGMLTAKFMAENGVARELLESQMAQLRTALQGQGLQVDKVEVVQQSHANAASFFQHQQRERGSDQAKSQSGQRGSNALYGDAADFEEELERTAYLREVGYGNTLNVTA